MAWFVEALEIAKEGVGTGRYRLTASSDEDGGGPWGDTSHDHATMDEAYACAKCQTYVDGITGFPTKKHKGS